MSEASKPVDRSPRHGRVALLCAGLVAFMVGASYAAVPLYQMFCQVTGFGGTTLRATAPANRILDRTITVRFDANVGNGLQWEFGPVETTQTLRIGENGLASYRATNTSDRAIVGTATYNVTPEQAGAYFNKLECFCFTEQRLEPGQSIDMPVSYFIDPAIVDDPDASRIGRITLSYTFYPVTPKRNPSTAATPAAAPVKAPSGGG